MGLCPITLTTPLVFGFKICMRTPCQIWGNLCKLFYLAYLLPVFSVNFSSYVNHLKIRYISIHVMNYYVCANMFAHENLLLHILFGLLLLSVLFCNDDHYGVLSKDFIYGCLVRNREQDPSMGDNFSAYNSRFATTTDVNSSVAISNLRFRFLKRQVSDSSHWPSHIHYLVWILLHAWMFIAILERLPFVWKTRLFRREFKWNGSSRWKCYRKTVISFEVLPLSRFHRKGLKFFVLFVWLTSARLPLEAKGDLF